MSLLRRPSQHFLLSAVLFGVAVFMSPGLTPEANAQGFALPGLDPPDTEEKVEQTLHTDRRVETKLVQFTNAARKLDTDEVLEHLESLRTADPRLVIQESSSVYVPLHRMLTRRIQGFKPEVREAIQNSDPSADVALSKIVGGDSVSDLVVFLQQHVGTKAAGRAHLILATIHADRGHNLAAQYWLAPLLTGESDPELKNQAKRLEAQILKRENPPKDSAAADNTKEGTGATADDSPDSNGDSVPEKSTEESEDDVKVESTDPPSEAAPSPKPDNSADAQSEAAPTDTVEETAGPPLIQERHWHKSLPIPAAARTRSQQFLRESKQLRAIPWSAWSPEIDEEQVYVRSPGMVSAFNVKSGQHVWTRTLMFEQQLAQAEDPSMLPGRFMLDRDAVQDALNSQEILDLHRNERLGRMTSDHDRLYLLSQLNHVSTAPMNRIMIRMRMGRESSAAAVLELMAIDKKTGRRLWTMGGEPVEEKFGNELAMAWFAGPPAVDLGRLYQVVERNAVVELACLDAATGRVLWTLPLAYPQQNISMDGARQLLAAQTSIHKGVIYSTTTTGWIVAVDAATHFLLWTHKLPTHSRNSSYERLQATGLFAGSLPPMQSTCRSHPPILCGRHLLVPTAESPQIMCVDAVTGKLRSSPASIARSTLVIHHDPEIFVVGSPTTIIGVSLPNIRKSWTVKLDETGLVPAGPGARQGSDLYVPMVDGSAIVIDITKGTLRKTIRRFRSAWSTGGLYASHENIISHAPDHLTRLSSSPAVGYEETDPLQHAMFLFESGDLKEASAAVAKIPVTALRRDAVRRLKFRIAVAMLKAESPGAGESRSKEQIATEAAHLEEIAGMAQTAQEKALTHFLRLDFLLRTGPENVVPSLIDALNLDESVLTVEIPVTSSLSELLADASANEPLTRNPLRHSGEHRIFTFRAWILQQLRDRIARADEKERASIILALAPVSDSTFIEMHSTDLTQESLRRAEAHLEHGECNEMVLQLLESAAESQLAIDTSLGDAQKPTNERIAEGFRKLREVALKSENGESVRNELVDRLLTAVQYELQSELPGLTIAAPEDVKKTLTERVIATPETPLTLLPVSNTGRVIGRTAGKIDVNLSSGADPVLSAFRWTLRSVPFTLQARSILEPGGAPWGITRDSTENRNEYRFCELSRFGSVLIIVEESGLSAFSLLEQRFLWRKRMPNGVSGRVLRFRKETFEPNDAGVEMLKLSMTGLGQTIVGGTTRWLCLRTEENLEVVDLYSGHPLWSMPEDSSYKWRLATRSGILRQTGFSDVDQLNPIDGAQGKRLPGMFVDFSPGDVILEAGGRILVTETTGSERRQKLLWIDARSGVRKHSIDLSRNSHVFIPDHESLASLSTEGTLQIVDLKTGQESSFPGALAAITNTMTVEPTKLACHYDLLNCYLYEPNDNAQGLIFSGASRVIAFKTAVAAFSRSSGRLSWVHSVKSPATLYLDGPEEAVLIAEQTANPGAKLGGPRVFNIPGLGVQMGQVYTLQGISRVTGNSRFSQRVSALRPIPDIRLSKTSGNQLELEAFGNRMRFLPTPVAAAP